MDNTKKKYDLITAAAVTVVVNILVIVGLYFHEPWFDEAQAYLLARDSSFHDLLMYWTHYEGHPPLWHLLLRGAVKVGLPYELALKSVNFIFVEAVLILVEFRSPFSRITKVIIPTSYFLLYQYSVVSRPYMMLTFFCLLAAFYYKDRDKKPVRYSIALILMCLSHSYGIAFAGGIVLSDLIGESIRERSAKKMISRVLSNKKLLISYSVLLVAALAILADIMPHSDTYAAQKTLDSHAHSFAACYIFSWLLIPSENLLTSFSSDKIKMMEEINPINEVIIAAVLSLIVWTLLFCISRKRKMIAELFIPYSFIAVLTSLYALPHHFGIFLMYMLFMLWTASDKEKITLAEFSAPLEKAGLSANLTKKIAVCSAAALSGMNLYWSGICYFKDISSPYDSAPELAQWIKDNGLEGENLLTTWSKSDIHMVNASSVASNAYFDKNIYYNLNRGMSFITHIVSDEDDIIKEKNQWKAVGEPDFMICDAPIETSFICEELDLKGNYVATAFIAKGERIFKDKTEKCDTYVMCTREKYKELYGKEYEVQTYKNS